MCVCHVIGCLMLCHVYLEHCIHLMIVYILISLFNLHGTELSFYCFWEGNSVHIRTGLVRQAMEESKLSFLLVVYSLFGKFMVFDNFSHVYEYYMVSCKGACTLDGLIAYG